MKLLFICVENTCRSQMAEGLARTMGLESASAGLNAGSGVNVDAIKAMEEVNIDISSQWSKSIDDLAAKENLEDFDYIISLCSADAADVCPGRLNMKAKSLNWNLEDPKGKDLSKYREVRQMISDKLNSLIAGT